MDIMLSRSCMQKNIDLLFLTYKVLEQTKIIIVMIILRGKWWGEIDNKGVQKIGGKMEMFYYLDCGNNGNVGTDFCQNQQLLYLNQNVWMLLNEMYTSIKV